MRVISYLVSRLRQNIHTLISKSNLIQKRKVEENTKKFKIVSSQSNQ